MRDILRPDWLTEAGIYGDETEPLWMEFRRQSMAATRVSHPVLQKESDLSVSGQRLSEGDCVRSRS